MRSAKQLKAFDGGASDLLFGVSGPFIEIRPSVDLDGGKFMGDLEDFVEAYKLILDNVYSGIIVCDRDSKVLYMNKFYADLLKTDRDKVMGKHIKEFFHSSRVPNVLKTGKMELGGRCSLRSDVALLVNRIPVVSRGKTVGVILQTVFKNFAEISELMARQNQLEKKVSYYKEGLHSVLSATYTFDSIIGQGASIKEAKRVAEKYAKTEAAVLISGATGTGKELFAHAVHMASRRKNGPFVCVNCAAIPRELLEAELFGYEPGAFTGGRRKGKAGKIEVAHRGTLFLDEIGDVPPNAQAKLLRVLETRKIDKLGSVKTTNVDFRLIAATNRDLSALIDRGEFREDLFYRMNTMTVQVPSLSERAEDIEALVRHFLSAMGRPGVRMTKTAGQMLRNYSWPGNIRELKNVVERAVSLTEDEIIDVEHLPCEITEFICHQPQVPSSTQAPLSKAMALCEREILLDALEVTNRNMSKTAQLLGISRSTLYEKFKIHNL